MIYFIEGKVIKKIYKRMETERGQGLVIQSGNLGFKVNVSKETFGKAKEGADFKLFTHLALREDGADLFGFETEAELEMFGLLNGISGIGPKSALSILSVASAESLKVAILSGKTDILTRASGIGPKIASRIVLELKNKIKILEPISERVEAVEANLDLIEVLIQIGYSRFQAKEAVSKITPEIIGFENRLREALKILGKK